MRMGMITVPPFLALLLLSSSSLGRDLRGGGLDGWRGRTHRSGRGSSSSSSVVIFMPKIRLVHQWAAGSAHSWGWLACWNHWCFLVNSGSGSSSGGSSIRRLGLGRFGLSRSWSSGFLDSRCSRRNGGGSAGRLGGCIEKLCQSMVLRIKSHISACRMGIVRVDRADGCLLEKKCRPGEVMVSGYLERKNREMCFVKNGRKIVASSRKRRNSDGRSQQIQLRRWVGV